MWRHKTVINKYKKYCSRNKAQNVTEFSEAILYFLFTISISHNMLPFFTFLANMVQKCTRTTPKMLKINVTLQAMIIQMRKICQSRYFGYGLFNLLPFICCQLFCHKNFMFFIICNYIIIIDRHLESCVHHTLMSINP